ncbi:hypothetical protein A4R26_00260 [Niastella populi]|uniref:Uncharacterized protein n=1 Tax=Niastella populi TaxID=550983 RepID=A0A1V9GCH9_9BACT|nr:hypothetical protein A4R26_00260 [Niastella populi]
MFFGPAALCIFRPACSLQRPTAVRAPWPGDTPVTAIARNIEINIKQLPGEKNVPAPLASNGFYTN